MEKKNKMILLSYWDFKILMEIVYFQYGCLNHSNW